MRLCSCVGNLEFCSIVDIALMKNGGRMESFKFCYADVMLKL